MTTATTTTSDSSSTGTTAKGYVWRWTEPTVCNHVLGHSDIVGQVRPDGHALVILEEPLCHAVDLVEVGIADLLLTCLHDLGLHEGVAHDDLVLLHDADPQLMRVSSSRACPKKKMISRMLGQLAPDPRKRLSEPL